MTTQQVRSGVTRPQKLSAKSASKTPANVKHAVSSWVEDRIKRIQKCHRIGSEIRRLYRDRARRNEMQKLAAKYGIPKGATRRYRQIAKLFTQSDMEELYDQFRAQNFAFTVTHFFVLVGVEKKTIRKKLAQDAVQMKLNITQLRKRKLRIEHSKGPGGRRPDVVRLHKQKDLHAAIHMESGKWHRWLDQLLGESRKITPSLRKRLTELREVVQDVQKLSGG